MSGDSLLPSRGHWLVPLAACAILAAFAHNVVHYYSLGDDAFISFRYAKHLASGLGLVWNDGERVEGYTNFLWVLLMAAGLRLGLTPETLSNAIGIASGVLVLAAVAAFAAGRRGWHDPLVFLAPACLALSRSFTAWSTGGLETQFFALVALTALFRFLREREDPGLRRSFSAWLLVIACLTRPEGLLFAGLAGSLFLVDVLERRRAPRALIAWGLPLALAVAAHFLWRRSYYGLWLPNTFYAKVGGFWWQQSIHYLAAFEEDYHILWFLPLALFALARGAVVHRFFGVVITAYLSYLVYIGGDRFEFRFLVVVLPLVYWLIAEGIGMLRLGSATLAIQGGLALVLLAVTHIGSIRPEARVTRYGIASVQDCRRYGAHRAEAGQFLRGLVEDGRLPRDLRIAVGGAGAIPYYTDWYTVDVFGLNDVTIAHQPLARRSVPGHEHVASPEYLRQRGVALWDVLDGPVLAAEPSLLLRKATAAGYTGELRCLEADGRYIAFATTLNPDEFARAFGRLKACDLEGGS